MAKTIVDLQELFSVYAWDTYQSTPTGILTRLFNRKLKRENADIEFRWEKVKFSLPEHHYTEKTTSESATTFVIDSGYVNRTDQEHKQRIRFEKETISTASFKLSKGYISDMKTGIEMRLPTSLLRPEGEAEQEIDTKKMATASFGQSLHVNTEEDSIEERKMIWKVDTTIPVKSGMVTKARLVVDEAISVYEFEADVKMKGTIVAVIRDIRDPSKFVQVVQGDVATILNDKWTSGKKPDDVTIDTDQREVYLPLGGTVEFRYGVSKTVEVSEEMIKTGEPSDSGQTAGNTSGETSDSVTSISRMYPEL